MHAEWYSENDKFEMLTYSAPPPRPRMHKFGARVGYFLVMAFDVDDEVKLGYELGVGVTGDFRFCGRLNLGGQMAFENQVPPLARHTEAELARSMGTSPVVECKGMVKVRSGRVVGVFLGPRDMAEMMKVVGFRVNATKSDGAMQVGDMYDVAFFLLDEDMP